MTPEQRTRLIAISHEIRRITDRLYRARPTSIDSRRYEISLVRTELVKLEALIEEDMENA